MKKGKYMVFLAAVLASIVAAPTLSAAAPVRLTESFQMEGTGCQMNIQLDGDILLSASIGPANMKPPSCVLTTPEGPWWDCPPIPCCVRVPDPNPPPYDPNRGSWNCSTNNNPDNPEFVCTSCTSWDGTNWNTPTSCPSDPGPGGGAPAPTCESDGSTSDPAAITSLVCTGCDEATGLCPPENCEPLRFVERNIFEKSGDGSTYCYNSTAGTQVCKTCTTNPTTKKTTCVTK
jgi:hypothetical protein